MPILPISTPGALRRCATAKGAALQEQGQNEAMDRANHRAPRLLRQRMALVTWAVIGVVLAAVWVPSYGKAYGAALRHDSYSPGVMPGAAHVQNTFNVSLEAAMGQLFFSTGRGTLNATFAGEPKSGWKMQAGGMGRAWIGPHRGALGFSASVSRNTGFDAVANPIMNIRLGVPIWFPLLAVAGALFYHLRARRRPTPAIGSPNNGAQGGASN
jgi:hypothetical protein